MKFNTLRPIVWVNNLDETLSFYTTYLGFVVDERNDDWRWASLHRDDIFFTITEANDYTFNKPSFTGSFYIDTDNVNQLWETLKDKVNIAYSIDNFEWQMREFAIYDNNGYMIQFGQDMDTIAS